MQMRPPIRLKPKSTQTQKSKAAWECVGGRRIYFRSRFEVKVATFLEVLQNGLKIANWEHEPNTFWFDSIKRGVRSYKPDFKVTRLDGSHFWIETKGYLDPQSKTKLKRFKKYYPEEELLLISMNTFLIDMEKVFEMIDRKKD